MQEFESGLRAGSAARPPRRGSRALAALAVTTMLAFLPAARAAPPTGAVLDDADRFAAVFKATSGTPDAATLQRDYLAPGTPGIAIFTQYRIKDAANLAHWIAKDRPAYEHAIGLCLPAAQRTQESTTRTIARVAAFVGDSGSAPAYFLFGADNSGGTASPDGLGIGLEVVCRDAQDPSQAERVIREYIAHEMTHVFQTRNGLDMHDHDLLQHVLSEGFADFVMGQVLDGDTSVDAKRRAFGFAHEAELRARLKADLAADAGDERWLFNGGHQPAGEPADMGYWIGRRICEAYYAKAVDKAAAVRTMLLLKDPKAILEGSGYLATSSGS